MGWYSSAAETDAAGTDGIDASFRMFTTVRSSESTSCASKVRRPASVVAVRAVASAGARGEDGEAVAASGDRASASTTVGAL